jgi:hypothetical protein
MSTHQQPNRQPSNAQMRFAYADMKRHSTNRRLHLILSIVTAGLWLIVWLAVSIYNTRQRNQIAREYGLPPETNIGYIILVFLVLFSVVGYKIYSDLFTGRQTDSLPVTGGPVAQPIKPESPWIYAKTNSPLGRSPIITATTYSQNEIEFGPPYEGKQRGVLTLRKNFDNSHDVYFGLEKGRFQCDNRTCSISAQFDNGLVKFFEAAPAQNESTPGVYLRNANNFIRFAESAHAVTITAHFFDQSFQTFEFDTRNLKW